MNRQQQRFCANRDNEHYATLSEVIPCDYCGRNIASGQRHVWCDDGDRMYFFHIPCHVDLRDDEECGILRSEDEVAE